jgi:hypothetical protein
MGLLGNLRNGVDGAGRLGVWPWLNMDRPMSGNWRVKLGSLRRDIFGRYWSFLCMALSSVCVWIFVLLAVW